MKNIFRPAEMQKRHTITISRPLAEILEQLTARRKNSVEETAIDLLRNALFDVSEASFRNMGLEQEPPIVRLANAIFAAAIDAGAAEIVVTVSTEKVTATAYSRAGTELSFAGWGPENEKGFLPRICRHISGRRC